MTNSAASGEKKSRFSKLGLASDQTILKNTENTDTDVNQESSEKTNTNGPGLKFDQPSPKLSKKDKKRKDDQIKDRATINVSEATRTRLKIFCATNKQVLQNWADEVLWKAMDRHEKALREAKEKKE